ncbi:MAG: hypothetical protein AAGI07_05905 [Bacteroidota bacterium]
MGDYLWTLRKFFGHRKQPAKGRLILPKQDLGNGLRVEVLLYQLNHDIENSFDFDYEPSERDSLVIHGREIGYSFVIHKDGNWVEGRNDPFRDIEREIASGKIEKRTNNKK